MGWPILPHFKAHSTASSRREIEVVCLSNAHLLSSWLGHPRGGWKIAAVLRNWCPNHERSVAELGKRAIGALRYRDYRGRIGPRHVENAKPRRSPDSKHNRVRVGFAVYLERVSRISESRALEKEYVLVGRRCSARVADDERAEEAGALLAHFVDVRMVHERPRSRRRELRHERIGGRDLRLEMCSSATEPRNAVHVAVLHLNAVPVDAGRLVEMVHDRDGNRNAACEVELGAEARSALDPAAILLDHEMHRRQCFRKLLLGGTGVGDRDHADAASGRCRSGRAITRAGSNLNADYQSGHVPMVRIIRRCGDRVRCEVNGEVTMEKPVPRTIW